MWSRMNIASCESSCIASRVVRRLPASIPHVVMKELHSAVINVGSNIDREREHLAAERNDRIECTRSAFDLLDGSARDKHRNQRLSDPGQCKSRQKPDRGKTCRKRAKRWTLRFTCSLRI